MEKTILDELKEYYQLIIEGEVEQEVRVFRNYASGYFRQLTIRLPTESAEGDIIYCQSHTLEEFLELFYPLFDLETLIMIEKK